MASAGLGRIYVSPPAPTTDSNGYIRLLLCGFAAARMDMVVKRLEHSCYVGHIPAPKRSVSLLDAVANGTNWVVSLKNHKTENPVLVANGVIFSDLMMHFWEISVLVIFYCLFIFFRAHFRPHTSIFIDLLVHMEIFYYVGLGEMIIRDNHQLESTSKSCSTHHTQLKKNHNH